MGLCRVFVVLTAAFSIAAALPAAVALAAGALLCHLIGLTYIAKQEHLDRIGSLWPLGFLAVPVVYGVTLALWQPRRPGRCWRSTSVSSSMRCRCCAAAPAATCRERS